jgi:hypothetical protein
MHHSEVFHFWLPLNPREIIARANPYPISQLLGGYKSFDCSNAYPPIVLDTFFWCEMFLRCTRLLRESRICFFRVTSSGSCRRSGSLDLSRNCGHDGLFPFFCLYAYALSVLLR